MTAPYNKLYEEPAYGLPEAAVYLKVPKATLRYWLSGRQAEFANDATGFGMTF